MTAYRPVASDHDGDWHLARFREFDRLKAQLGEPTPHMEIVRAMSYDVPDRERLWRAGAYAAGYSVLTAEAIWREWPVDRIVPDLAGFRTWLEDNWGGIHTRTPRRTVRTVDSFYRCIASYVEWMTDEAPLLGRGASYETWWTSANRIAFMGRYIVIRLLELLRRWEFLDAHLPDIRAMDAESPVRCLALLVPERADDLLANDDLPFIDDVANVVMRVTGTDSHFRYAALLCEYRKCYEKRADYPGNQTDEELGYQFGKHAQHWRDRGFTSDLFRVRKALVPDLARGEDHGWTGQRTLAGASLRDHGVNWSDLRFDYQSSEAAGRPVEWAS